jgi:hypothetical protein
MECGKTIEEGELYFEMQKKKHWQNKTYHQSVKTFYIHTQCFIKLQGKVKTLTSQLDTARKVAEANCDH